MRDVLRATSFLARTGEGWSFRVILWHAALKEGSLGPFEFGKKGVMFGWIVVAEQTALGT